jgi:hypothetical protein
MNWLGNYNRDKKRLRFDRDIRDLNNLKGILRYIKSMLKFGVIMDFKMAWYRKLWLF